MDISSPSGAAGSPDYTAPGNLEILAHTAASQASDLHGAGETPPFHGGFPVFKLSDTSHQGLPLLYSHIKTDGQPGGPMLSQAQIQKIFGGPDPKEVEKRASPLSIITTTLSDPGQVSPAAPSSSQILNYGSSNVAGDAMLSAINYNDNEILQDGAFDVPGHLGIVDDGLLGGMSNQRLTENASGHTYDLFDGEGDSLHMEAFSPIMSDSGGLGAGGAMGEANESSSSADLSIEEKKKVKSKGKASKVQGQVSPGKPGQMQCNQCSKLFNNSSALAKHKLTHSAERKFLCTICEKKFKRQDHLNGHLMTHRDKKPYQCTVQGCTKSYCDARSLRRHLENHHQHNVDQIAIEMVKAQSMAAEVLADVQASTGMIPQATSATNPKSSTDPNSAKPETITGSKISSNIPVTVTNTLVTKTQFVPVSVVSSAIVTSNTVVSPQPLTQATQSHIFPYDIMVQQQQKLQKEQQQQQAKKQQLKQEKQQLKQQQQQKELQQQELRLKLEKEQQELKINLIHEEIKAAVQREQQQQQQHIVSSSPKSAWQDPRLVQNNYGSHPNSQPGSGLQSPSSGESQSPGYSALSPSVGGAQPQSPIRSPAQMLYSSPQGTSIAMTGTQSTQSGGEAYSEDSIKPISCNVCKKRFKTLPALNGHLRLHGGKDPNLRDDRKKKEKTPMNSGKPAATMSSQVIFHSTTPPQPANGTTQVARGGPHPPNGTTQMSQGGQNPGVQESQFRQPVQSPVQSPPVLQDRDVQAQRNLIQQYQQQIQQHQEQLEQQKQQELQIQQQQQKQQQELQIQQQLQEQLQQQIENGNIDIQQIVQLQLAQQQQQQKLTPLDIQQLQQLQLQQQQEKQQQQQQLELQLQQEQQQLEQQQLQHARMMEQAQISTPSPQVPSSPHVGVPSSPLIARSPHPAQSHMLQRQSSVDSVQSPLQSPPVHPPPPYQFVRPSMEQEQVILNRGGDSYMQHVQNPLQTQNSNVLHSGIGHVNFDPRSSSYHDNTVIRQDTFLGHQNRLNPGVSDNNQSDDINTLDNITEVLNKIEGEEQAKRQARSMHPHVVENVQNVNRLNSASNTNSIAQFSGKPYSHSVQNPVYGSDSAVSNSQGDTHSIDLLHNYHVKHEPMQHISSKPSATRAAEQRSSAFQSSSLSDNNGSVNTMHNDHSNVPYSPMSPIRESADFFPPVSPIQTKNVEIKRRLSAGPEDFLGSRSNYSASSFTKESASGTYIKPIQSNGANRPRMRSKSGEDHKLLRWRSEGDHSFMKPRTRLDEGSHRPRSKTDEHLSKWNNKDILSRSDGAGVFRNPTSFPSSFKIKRKNRPAPLIIPPHQNHCGFQSRLRSPRVWFEGADISHSVTVPYTPPPMLSPVRQGSGLFWSLSGSFPTSAGAPPPTPRSATQSLIRSASIKTEDGGVKAEGAPPESDVLPHVNIGSQYQAALPDFNANKSRAQLSPCKEDLLWDPSLMAGVSDEDVQLYQDLACCAAVKANGANVEHALHLLYLAKGNIQNAMLMLMTGSVSLPSNHSLIDYRYQENETWSSNDIENYTQAIFKHDKDFFNVANEMKTKSVKQCIQFYYLWKKVLPDDHKRLRIMRRKREQLYNLRSRQQAEQQKTEPVAATVVVKVEQTEAIVEEEPEAMGEAEESDSESSISGTAEDQNTENNEDEELTDPAMSDSPTAMPQNIPSPIAIPPVQQAFTCDYPECNSSFSSKPALNAHLKIHMHNSKPPGMHNSKPPGRASPSEMTSKSHSRPRKPSPSAARAAAAKEEQQEGVFPCKLCGREFSKVKSRSAHMKIHRPEQEKEKEKKAKAANRQAQLAQKGLHINPDPYELPLSNGPLQE